MLFYNFNTLDDFIKNNLIVNIKEEIVNLTKIIELYNNKKAMPLSEDSLNSINTILDLVITLKEDLYTIISLHDKGLNENYNEIKANLVEYNKKGDELFQKILDFENTSVEINPQDNNTLIVSEKEQKAYLPFYWNEIKKIFKNCDNKYSTLQEVVDDLYVVSLDKFKNSYVSRFKESFNLIRNKEHGTFIEAFDLGLELMFKYELNPIIIAACRNSDELDIYLSCLEENELSDFDCFEIKFEVAPQSIKSK